MRKGYPYLQLAYVQITTIRVQLWRSSKRGFRLNQAYFKVLQASVGYPEPDIWDLHVFRPSESGSIGQGYGTGSGSFPFLIKVLSGLK